MPETTVSRYVRRLDSGRYRVVLPESVTGIRHYGTFDTQAEAEAARDRALAEPEPVDDAPIVEGLTTEYAEWTADELWSAAFAAQDRAAKREQARADQSITVPGVRAFAIAYTSDWHIGDARTNYRQLKTDLETIRDTDRMWAEYHGDGWNNWIVGKLAGLQRGEPIPFDAEVQLFAEAVGLCRGKWLWAIPGNHDNWSKLLAGIDKVRDVFAGCRVLYDPDEIVFALKWNGHQLTYKARHKWRYSSIYNATHGIEAGWQRGDVAFDIGLGGHTHRGTYCRPFTAHGRRRFAVLTGTYETTSEYGRELGFAPTDGMGSGAHVFYPDGRCPAFFEDVQTAADFLRWLNRE
jgi:hypothetical protein